MKCERQIYTTSARKMYLISVKEEKQFSVGPIRNNMLVRKYLNVQCHR